MSNSVLIPYLKNYIKKQFAGDTTGHDWWHMLRVYKMAIRLAKEEKQPVNRLVIKVAALLHDIGDWKFNEDEHAGSQKAKKLLKPFELSQADVDHICFIVDHVSFKGAQVANQMKTLEGFIVQDADRLDGLGAIGIARTFAYSAKVNRPIYDPMIKPSLHQNSAAYKNSNSSAINHFYEKLLLLKDKLNTQSAKRIAQARHRFMEHYLEEFYLEWDGKK